MAEYIDRGAIVKSLLAEYEPINTNFPMSLSIEQIAETVNTIPTADVAPVVHGHWIKTGDADERYNSRGYFFFRCSCCGFGLGGQTVEKEKYCCNCGAKMDEEAKGDA